MRVERGLVGGIYWFFSAFTGHRTLGISFSETFWLIAVTYAHPFPRCLMIKFAHIFITNQRHLYRVKKLKKEKRYILFSYFSGVTCYL